MNYTYFVKCAECGYPLATETYYGYVGDRRCSNCGSWEVNPDQPDATRGIDASPARVAIHMRIDPPECPDCGAPAVVITDLYRSDFDLRLTVFCPSCWFYRRYLEIVDQPLAAQGRECLVDQEQAQPPSATQPTSGATKDTTPDGSPGKITL